MSCSRQEDGRQTGGFKAVSIHQPEELGVIQPPTSSQYLKTLMRHRSTIWLVRQLISQAQSTLQSVSQSTSQLENAKASNSKGRSHLGHEDNVPDKNAPRVTMGQKITYELTQHAKGNKAITKSIFCFCSCQAASSCGHLQ
jgi:hypothetical protein